MSIGRRLFDLARTELNSLLDKAARLGEDDEADDERSRQRASSASDDGLDAFSEAELEAELDRRRLEREIEDRARQASARARASAPPPPRPETGSARSASHGKTPDAVAVARAYAALELKPGTDFTQVKQQYRKMMRKYHPDRHAGSPEKEKAAHQLAQKLTDAYKTLETRLRPRT
ncbi:MAG: J domain-containing protein [Myxococcales bacterium]|nr:J domain-containing protein [Myxococcales bacterium]